jgi:hypothetical protein
MNNVVPLQRIYKCLCQLQSNTDLAVMPCMLRTLMLESKKNAREEKGKMAPTLQCRRSITNNSRVPPTVVEHR